MTQAEILEALLDAIADRVAAKLGRPIVEHYSKTSPPPHHSWRAVLEAGRRGDLEVTRQGRAVLVSVDAYNAWLASATPRKSKPELVPANDADVLGRLGVRLRGVSR